MQDQQTELERAATDDDGERGRDSPGAGSVRAMGRRLVGLGAFVGAAVWLDQATKALAHRHLRGRPFATIVEGFVELRYSLNRGAFYGIGADLPEAYRTLVLSAVSCAALGLGLSIFLRTTASQRRLRWGLYLLLGGGTGNLVDRVRRGEVIDFIHLHVRDTFHWATFNLADVYLTAGLVLLMLEVMGPTGDHRDGGDQSPDQGPGGGLVGRDARLEHNEVGSATRHDPPP